MPADVVCISKMTEKSSFLCKSSLVKSLPDLNEGRRAHACGYFYDDDRKVVLVVTGGYHLEYLTSTEISIEGANKWTFGHNLPASRHGLRGVSVVNGNFLVIGGYADPKKGFLADDDEHTDEILEYNPVSGWIKVGRLAIARGYHAVSIVDVQDIIHQCYSWAQDSIYYLEIELNRNESSTF